MHVSQDAQRLLHYHFHKPALLEEALTHRSHRQGKSSGHVRDNERLEFVGDAVLGLIVSEYLAETFPELAEGALSQIRARLVARATLADAARQLGLGPLLRVGRGEDALKAETKILCWPTRWRLSLRRSIWMGSWPRPKHLC